MLRPYWHDISSLSEQGHQPIAILAWIEADIRSSSMEGFWDYLDINEWRSMMLSQIRSYLKKQLTED